MLAILMRGGDLTFIIVSTFAIGFLCGAGWMTIGKTNKKAEKEAADKIEKKPASVIELFEEMESRPYEWKKGVNN